VANQVFVIRLVQWLGWVFESQKKEKKKKSIIEKPLKQRKKHCQSCDLFTHYWGSAWVHHKLGNAPVLRSGTGSWVLSGSSGVRHPLRPVIRLGLRNQRKKERKALEKELEGKRHACMAEGLYFVLEVKFAAGMFASLPNPFVRACDINVCCMLGPSICTVAGST